MSFPIYRGDFEKKTVINKLNKLNNNDNFQIFHASTILEDQKVKSNGGRVLSVTAKSKILKDALRDIYQSINLIDWPQSYYRKDIGFKALKK